ncbi:molybdenum cofactor biosynthesis protein MoaE [Allorhodopirellula solitaria]|uniref:Molybdopterin synthase catalytic subunit n=1 Tax=Allorhodopirellula solitaria TaxID=2527987 RepID=A0A5C5XPJ2_9BACT|nr:molybdenum cofactor biosynthesis protein MoaE [Allorhodopirellula solitaria]TWT64850.1 Molybdopterin synthase catalytic subunit [Allorhodopirellula solitaria]
MEADLSVLSPGPHIRVALTEGPIIAPANFAEAARQAANAGAVITFLGCVRGSEATSENTLEPIDGLEYEIYEPMTSRELDRLAHSHAIKHGVIAVDVEHSFGFVGNGGCSFVLQVAAAHRKEAIAFVDDFIDAMKKHVPIWKVPRSTADEGNS